AAIVARHQLARGFAFALRQVTMTETRNAPEEGTPRRTSPEDVDDPSCGENVEFTALRAIVEGTAHSIGEKFFQTLDRHLAQGVEAQYAFVAEFASPEITTKARTLAFWAKNRLADNYEWTLAGTPCEEVVHGKLCHHPSGVRQTFPNDKSAAERRIESYLGAPLRDPEGAILGHLAVFDEGPMPEEPRRLLTFHIFAARAAAAPQPDEETRHRPNAALRRKSQSNALTGCPR